MAYLVLKIYKLSIMNFTGYIFFGTDLNLILCIIIGILIYISSIYIFGIKELEINKWKEQRQKIN